MRANEREKRERKIETAKKKERDYERKKEKERGRERGRERVKENQSKHIDYRPYQLPITTVVGRVMNGSLYRYHTGRKIS